MIDKDLIKRINFLANKKKCDGLTEEEQVEQNKLREEYIKLFREGFKEQLINTKIVDKNGIDVTPKKLRKAKQERDKS